MSLPTRIQFLDKDHHTIATEFYNAGWWVPDDIGTTIADLYSEELWVSVVAYDTIYDRDGYPIGDVAESEYTWYSVETCEALRSKINNEPPVTPNPNIKFESVKVPLVNKAIPAIIAQELVGVQPMASEAGQVFQMKRKFGEEARLKEQFEKHNFSQF